MTGSLSMDVSTVATSRLLRLGQHDDHGALSRVRGRGPGGYEHPAMVVGRAAALNPVLAAALAMLAGWMSPRWVTRLT